MAETVRAAAVMAATWVEGLLTQGKSKTASSEQEQVEPRAMATRVVLGRVCMAGTRGKADMARKAMGRKVVLMTAVMRGAVVGRKEASPAVEVSQAWARLVMVGDGEASWDVAVGAAAALRAVMPSTMAAFGKVYESALASMAAMMSLRLATGCLPLLLEIAVVIRAGTVRLLAWSPARTDMNLRS